METVNLEDDAAGDLGEHQLVASPTGMPILEVEEVLRSADGWHFDAFRLAEVTQGRPLSTITFWLMQQNGVVRDAGGACGLANGMAGSREQVFLLRLQTCEGRRGSLWAGS